jgi:hypothetical protein
VRLDVQSGANPLNQHGEGIAHQGVVVNDINGHGVLKNETKSMRISANSATNQATFVKFEHFF